MSTITEERLRNYLDSNQMNRERMCLALLPILGPYTNEQPRRPKGGPDGGRDLEAIFQGSVIVWGAVGFKNGGGADMSARELAMGKFKEDLERALQENALLQGFVFFTNVDLTPTQKADLHRYAADRGIKVSDVFDMERLRHALDKPAGLITRLQYLDISMSQTEQASLVAQYGSHLKEVLTEKLDRVECAVTRIQKANMDPKTLEQLVTKAVNAAITHVLPVGAIEAFKSLEKAFNEGTHSVAALEVADSEIEMIKRVVAALDNSNIKLLKLTLEQVQDMVADLDGSSRLAVDTTPSLDGVFIGETGRLVLQQSGDTVVGQYEYCTNEFIGMMNLTFRTSRCDFLRISRAGCLKVSFRGGYKGRRHAV